MTSLRSVLVLGEHRLVAEAVASGLSSRGFDALGLALEGTAIPLARLAPGGVVLLDMHESWGSTQRRLASVGESEVGARVVLMTHGAPAISETAARRAGVWGWFSRKSTLGTATTVVRAVLMGRTMFARQGPLTEIPRQRQPLTTRELEVLQQIAAGTSYADIAERLQVSHNTVRTHATNIRTKLGVRTRSAAVAAAHGVRIVDAVERAGSR